MQLSYLAEDGGAVIDIVQNGTMRTEILAARIISNHLDLLGKNQMKQLARACSCKLEEVLLAAARIREPVSYTHLDVYKRQIQKI